MAGLPDLVAARGGVEAWPTDVRATVIAILADQALIDPAEIRDDASLADLGIGSLGVVECIFAIEEAFDIAVPFNANTPDAGSFDVSSVAAVVAAVERLVTGRL